MQSHVTRPQLLFIRACPVVCSPSAMNPLFIRLWGWPFVLGLLTASGLITALVSESWGDAWSWCGLGVPVAVIAWCAWLRPVFSSVSVSSNNNTGNP